MTNTSTELNIFRLQLYNFYFNFTHGNVSITELFQSPCDIMPALFDVINPSCGIFCGRFIQIITKMADMVFRIVELCLSFRKFLLFYLE